MKWVNDVLSYKAFQKGYIEQRIALAILVMLEGDSGNDLVSDSTKINALIIDNIFLYQSETLSVKIKIRYF